MQKGPARKTLGPSQASELTGLVSALVIQQPRAVMAAQPPCNH